MSKKLWEFISLRKMLFILGEGILIYASVIFATHFLWGTPYKELFQFSVFFKSLFNCCDCTGESLFSRSL